MNKVLFTMAVVSAVAVGTPAVAQYSTDGRQNGYQDDRGDDGYARGDLSARIAQLEARLQAGIRSGAITRQEAMPLRRQLRQLTIVERQYGIDGMNGRERADIQQRMRIVRQQIRSADGGNQARWDEYDRQDGYGRWDRADGDDAYGREGRFDRRDRDDGDRNRTDSEEGESAYQRPIRGGVGGGVDSMFGIAGLRVGQRAPDDLYGIPNEHRDQYRDDIDSYFRTDGRQVYQIDTRTRTVLRVYSMNR